MPNNKIMRRSAGGTWVTVIDGDDYVSADDYTAKMAALDATDAALAATDATLTAHSVPAGGAAGDMLTKSSATDYATVWAPPKFGTSTEYVEIVPTADDKLRLVEDTSTGRPYLSFHNWNGGGYVVRKGLIGNPEATSATSDIYVRSDYGDLQLEAPAGGVYVNSNRVLTTADEGSGNGIDADTVDGFDVAPPSAAPGVDKIIRSSPDGRIYSGWINTVSGAMSSVPTRIYTSTDSLIRYMTPENFRATVSSHAEPCTITRVTDSTAAGVTNITVTLGATVGGLSTTGATAVFGSITAVPSDTGAGYATVYPAALGSNPEGSNVNFLPRAGEISNGFFFVLLNGSKQFKVYRHSAARLLLDVQGFVYG